MASKRKRKKKRVGETMERYKTPLVFAESPIEGDKHYRTPVQAARNPYLAPSIPVDEFDAKWVSPHFPNNISSLDLAILGKLRGRQRVNPRKKGKENNKQNPTKAAVKTLDFRHETRSAHRSTTKHDKRRRSARLRNKDMGETRKHFLFREIESQFEKRTCTRILAPDTPGESQFPVVLRRLRNKSRKSRV
ncbi:uncharacterized protein LOC5503361 [Nematostella vectensis]|uniref:uncharacterized protein LOC5503361 n=1 Tax=Nematostella vectensis TaxID=45351 RepID=UPI0020772573|nr:uncharacterized protein LOC5503361 [Nematostella vectensis]